LTKVRSPFASPICASNRFHSPQASQIRTPERIN
jgi:hypothetical protein